ncbi:MAG: GyrI-like domain-containing protein, partial [Bacillota bacterium]
VQMMHIGPYSNEQITIDEIFRFIEENGLKVDYGPERKHHEIYLSDPRKSKPENLKTVIRYPVKRG